MFDKMTLSDWISKTINSLKTLPPSDAIRLSGMELWLGGIRALGSIDGLFRPEEPHWNRDFDVLCILDACRVDMLEDACDRTEWLPPRVNVDTLRSVGSTSEEWMSGMFAQEHEAEMANTIYVTANLFAEEFDISQFAACSIVTDERELAPGVSTADPGAVTDRAITLWRNREAHGADRMIVHYMQPHTPFRSRPEWFNGDLVSTTWGHGFYELAAGRLPHNEFRTAYWDNLDWIMEHVDILRRNCEGTIALSADHGNGMGEWGVYGHPFGVPVPSVKQVPYVTLTGVDTRERVPDVDESAIFDDVDADQVAERLEDLGYV